MSEKIIIFDTTLRDGEQSPGASLNVFEKVEIAHQLANLNVDVIEAGFPVSSQAQFDAVQQIADSVDAIITGLARSIDNDIKADVSLLSSKISAQGPIYKGSWIFTGRRTYFDQFVSAYNRIQGNDNPFTYYFWDTHLKVQTTPLKYNKFIYSQFNGSDNLSVNISAVYSNIL